jgi:hypothetical protein
MPSNLTEPSSVAPKPRRTKPPIWSDGRQAPRFDTAAFFRVTLDNARSLAARGLDGVGLSARRGSAAFRDGLWRLAPERLGRTGQYLPGHQTMAAALADLARLAAAAGAWAAGPAPVEPLPFRSWDAAPPATGAPPPPAPATSPLRAPPRRPVLSATDPGIAVDTETLQAIRMVVRAANVQPQRPLRLPPEPDPVPPTEPRAARLPDIAPPEPLPPGRLQRAAAATLGALALAVAWPAGAVQALAAHLRGEDLREL